MVPAVLLDVLDDIASHSRVEAAGDWTNEHDERWSLSIKVALSVAATAHVPNQTLWHMVVGPNQPADGVYIYPDAVDGLKVTFPHQDYNGHSASTLPWRLGKPCLERATVTFKREDWTDEPVEVHDRILWKLSRLLDWIDSAAQGTLLADGDPLELPAFPQLPLVPLIGFTELPKDLHKWTHANAWGIAKLGSVPSAQSTSFLSEFRNLDGTSAHKPVWGNKLIAAEAPATALWIRLNELPVIEPWQAPRTWHELSICLKKQGIDLEKIVVLAGALFRKGISKIVRPTLLLGFPMAHTVGGPLDRFHWLAIGKVPLTSKTEKRPGFRARDDNHRSWDKELVHSSRELDWVRTENWASDQIRSRGEAEQSLRDKKILILGAGSLGSIVAENLVRMGVRQIGVLDSDVLNVGNLSRHALTLSAAGKPKAEALMEYLNDCLPDISSRAFNTSFPPTQSGHISAVRNYDVIIDCTASDDVLDAMAAFDWQTEKIFISLSITWRAEGLLAFSATEAMFPSQDAKLQFQEAPTPNRDLRDTRIEGIGCWHGVFPAAADDMALWGAVCTKFIRKVVLNPGRYSHYYKQNDGLVELYREQ